MDLQQHKLIILDYVMYVTITQCKGIQQSLGFRIPHQGFRIPGSWFHCLSVELGFWISILSRILDSMSCIPDSRSKNFTDFGIWTPLHGAITWISYSWSVKLGFSPFCSWLKKKINMQTWWWSGAALNAPLAVDIVGYMDRSGCPFSASSEFPQIP